MACRVFGSLSSRVGDAHPETSSAHRIAQGRTHHLISDKEDLEIPLRVRIRNITGDLLFENFYSQRWPGDCIRLGDIHQDFVKFMEKEVAVYEEEMRVFLEKMKTAAERNVQAFEAEEGLPKFKKRANQYHNSEKVLYFLDLSRKGDPDCEIVLSDYIEAGENETQEEDDARDVSFSQEAVDTAPAEEQETADRTTHISNLRRKTEVWELDYGVEYKLAMVQSGTLNDVPALSVHHTEGSLGGMIYVGGIERDLGRVNLATREYFPNRDEDADAHDREDYSLAFRDDESFNKLLGYLKAAAACAAPGGVCLQAQEVQHADRAFLLEQDMQKRFFHFLRTWYTDLAITNAEVLKHLSAEQLATYERYEKFFVFRCVLKYVLSCDSEEQEQQSLEFLPFDAPLEAACMHSSEKDAAEDGGGGGARSSVGSRERTVDLQIVMPTWCSILKTSA